MVAQVLTTLIALIIALVLAYLLSTKTNNRVIIRDALVSTLLSTAIMTMFWLQVEAHKLRDFRYALVETNVLDGVDKMLASLSPTDPMANPLRERRNAYVRDLDVLLEGTVLLQDETEVINHWIHGVRGAATTIDATNVVDPDYWQQGSKFSSVQKDLQIQSLARGIRIRRIFLYEPLDDAKKVTIRDLGKQQVDIGVSVRYLTMERAASTSGALKLLSKVGGTMDIVIFDISRVLLTNTRPRELTITHGRLTRSRQFVDAARQLYEEWWSIASEQLPQ